MTKGAVDGTGDETKTDKHRASLRLLMPTQPMIVGPHRGHRQRRHQWKMPWGVEVAAVTVHGPGEKGTGPCFRPSGGDAKYADSPKNGPVPVPARERLRRSHAEKTRSSRGHHWMSSAVHQRIAEIMASAVAKEKSLPPISLHPDDPVELLFWGVEDDWTEILFKQGLRAELGIDLSYEDIDLFCVSHLTLSEVIAFCVGNERH